ncbi:hypothetical protein MCERE19_00454 [Spirosomataceae bacterium]|jgi:hypothetical protein
MHFMKSESHSDIEDANRNKGKNKKDYSSK